MVLRVADSTAKPRYAVESFNRKVFPVVLLAVAAILLLLCPVVVTQLNNWEQMRTADKYSRRLITPINSYWQTNWHRHTSTTARILQGQFSIHG